jgi:hypothetical protein
VAKSAAFASPQPIPSLIRGAPRLTGIPPSHLRQPVPSTSAAAAVVVGVGNPARVQLVVAEGVEVIGAAACP